MLQCRGQDQLNSEYGDVDWPEKRRNQRVYALMAFPFNGSFVLIFGVCQRSQESEKRTTARRQTTKSGAGKTSSGANANANAEAQAKSASTAQALSAQ